jgi:helix-turn-helix protein
VAPTASSRATLAASSFTDFGTLLRVLRHRARLTQRQLGIAVGYSEAQISRLEQGRRAGDRRSGGRYPARWVPKNVKILAQPSIVASGRYIGVW